MSKKKLSLGCLILVCISLALIGFASSSFSASDGVKYLKNNIHTQMHKQGEYRASYANWTDPGKNHVIIPVNTPVTVNNFRRGFALVTQDTKITIYFEFDDTKMGMNEDKYIGLITSPQPVKLESFSEVDRKGIKDGKAYVGMTKDGVRTALGYPAAHQTPSLNDNAWVYWTNRFRSFKIEFNGQGKVTKIQ